MKKFEETLDNFNIEYPLENIDSLDKFLFVDIETTGFTARSSYLYLIGCAYYSAEKWHIIQWFAETPEQEADIIKYFWEFAEYYKYLVHFNGNNFDLPFLKQKADMLGINIDLDKFEGIDIYRRISSYKFFLKLPNCKQKTLEQYLGINRIDAFSGGELITIYHDYIKNPTEFSEKALILHNAEDVKGMLNILPMLSYYDLLNGNIKAKKVQANHYSDLSGRTRKELLITISLPVPIPKPLYASANSCYFRAEDDIATIKVPLYEEELKYFYSNYKDYYYLPDEDVALHKSVATFVEKDYRIQAIASNCYTRKQSTYLPQWDYIFEPFYKREYKGREIFFELTPELKKDRAAFTAYAKHIMLNIAASF